MFKTLKFNNEATASNSNNESAAKKEHKDGAIDVAALGAPAKKVNKTVAPADNQTVEIASEVEHENEESNEEGGKQQYPSNVVVVRDGGKV
jgi:hypothetical protein